MSNSPVPLSNFSDVLATTVQDLEDPFVVEVVVPLNEFTRDQVMAEVRELLDALGIEDLPNLTDALASKQPLDPALSSLSALATVADRLLYATGPDAYGLSPLTAYGRQLVAAGNAAQAQALVGLIVGTNVQAYDADLSSIAASGVSSLGLELLKLVSAAEGRQALGAVSAADLTAAIQAVVGMAPAELNTLKEIADALLANGTSDAALVAVVAGKLAKSANLSDLANVATARTNLGLVPGANVQAFDTDLAAIAALTTTTFGRSLLTLADGPAVTANIGAVPVHGFGQCYLVFISGTSIRLDPFDGVLVFVNGAYLRVPAAGVSLANTGLNEATLYHVYAYLNAGVLALEASATANETDATYGHQIKAGDPSRTLVGLVYMDTGGVFANTGPKRYVLSYFNRRDRAVIGPGTAATTAATAYAEISTAARASFLSWGPEAVDIEVVGYASNSTAGGLNSVICALDAAVSGSATICTSGAVNQSQPVGAKARVIAAKGLHYATAQGYVSAGTGSFTYNVTGRIRG